MTLTFRPETVADIDAIYAIERDAFERDAEADLVNKLRDNGKLKLSMLALVDEKPVAHIAYSPGMVEHESGQFEVVVLAPVAVLPDYQKQGIGGALIEASLTVIAEQGHELVFLIGHPEYYPRFGFIPAAAQGFDCAYTTPGEANLHFMVKALASDALAGKSGYLYFSPEFDGV